MKTPGTEKTLSPATAPKNVGVAGPDEKIRNEKNDCC